MRGNPSIISILMRSGTVGSEAQRRVVREQCDYLIEPPMPDIGLRDWKKFDQAIQEGYDAARACIEKNGIPLTHVMARRARHAVAARRGGDSKIDVSGRVGAVVRQLLMRAADHSAARPVRSGWRCPAWLPEAGLM